MRHCATRRKVAGLKKFFTQSFLPHYGPGVDSASTELSTRDLPWEVKAADAYGWQPYHLQVLPKNPGSFNLLHSSGHI